MVERLEPGDEDHDGCQAFTRLSVLGVGWFASSRRRVSSAPTPSGAIARASGISAVSTPRARRSRSSSGPHAAAPPELTLVDARREAGLWELALAGRVGPERGEQLVARVGLAWRPAQRGLAEVSCAHSGEFGEVAQPQLRRERAGVLALALAGCARCQPGSAGALDAGQPPGPASTQRRPRPPGPLLARGRLRLCRSSRSPAERERPARAIDRHWQPHRRDRRDQDLEVAARAEATRVQTIERHLLRQQRIEVVALRVVRIQDPWLLGERELRVAGEAGTDLEDLQIVEPDAVILRDAPTPRPLSLGVLCWRRWRRRAAGARDGRGLHLGLRGRRGRAGIETIGVLTGGFSREKADDGGGFVVFESIGKSCTRLDATSLG